MFRVDNRVPARRNEGNMKEHDTERSDPNPISSIYSRIY